MWEIAIKRSLGKLTVPDEYLTLLLEAGVQPLAVSIVHAATVEGAAIVSRDDALRPYGVTLVW